MIALLGQMGDLSEQEKSTNCETLVHIHNVNQLLQSVIANLQDRATNHDRSKLHDPELSTFNKFTPLLKETKYGSDKYLDYLKSMKPALDNHYINNSHHPEHFENSINGMSLLDLLEMVIDWKASTLRTKDGDIRTSLKFNKDRFKIDTQLHNIIINTLDELGL
jgi:hypothetical protein